MSPGEVPPPQSTCFGRDELIEKDTTHASVSALHHGLLTSREGIDDQHRPVAALYPPLTVQQDEGQTYFERKLEKANLHIPKPKCRF
jgi:hypothetical protein